jgi:hypothetical protein
VPNRQSSIVNQQSAISNQQSAIGNVKFINYQQLLPARCPLPWPVEGVPGTVCPIANHQIGNAKSNHPIVNHPITKQSLNHQSVVRQCARHHTTPLTFRPR